MGKDHDIPRNKYLSIYLLVHYHTEFENPFFREKLQLFQIINVLQKLLYGCINEKQLNKLLNRIIEKKGIITVRRKVFTLIMRERKVPAKEMYAPRNFIRTLD
jgi:hypothetical protein